MGVVYDPKWSRRTDRWRWLRRRFCWLLGHEKYTNDFVWLCRWCRTILDPPESVLRWWREDEK